MRRFIRGMIISSILFALTGCSMNQLPSISGFSPTGKEYEIVGSDFDKSFRMAHMAMTDSGFDVYNVNKSTGEIEAQLILRDASSQDTRTITTKHPEIKFSLERAEQDRLVFDLESKTGSRKEMEAFVEQYGKHVDFFEVIDEEEREKAEAVEYEKNRYNEQVITEIRTGGSVLREKKYDFSRDEIIQIQVFLYRLGYDPGPADGIMNRKTFTAIEKFKAENKIVRELF